MVLIRYGMLRYGAFYVASLVLRYVKFYLTKGADAMMKDETENSVLGLEDTDCIGFARFQDCGSPSMKKDEHTFIVETRTVKCPRGAYGIFVGRHHTHIHVSDLHRQIYSSITTILQPPNYCVITPSLINSSSKPTQYLIQLKIALCHSKLLSLFVTQCPSLGKCKKRLGTPKVWRTLNVCNGSLITTL